VIAKDLSRAAGSEVLANETPHLVEGGARSFTLKMQRPKAKEPCSDQLVVLSLLDFIRLTPRHLEAVVQFLT
jgi:hypothetical protein